MRQGGGEEGPGYRSRCHYLLAGELKQVSEPPVMKDRLVNYNTMHYRRTEIKMMM